MKSLVSGVLVRLGSLSSEDKFEEPGPKCPGSIRKSFDQGNLPKSLVPRVLARLGSPSTEGIFLKAWFQLPWFNQKVLSPSVQKGLKY